MEIPVGTAFTAKTVVDETNIASAVGSGLVDVFATPMMIALMELAASECLRPFLEPGQASVGARVNVSHTGATPLGMTVSATAAITHVDNRRVEFAVEMSDEKGEIGSGAHTRYIVDMAAFMEKAAAKALPE